MRADHLAFYLSRLTAEQAAGVFDRAAVMRDELRDRTPLPPSRWDWLVERCAEHSGLTPAEVLASDRRLSRARARAAIVVVLRDVCEASWSEVAQVVHRDRTTAIHAYREAQGERYEPELTWLRELLVEDVLKREAS